MLTFMDILVSIFMIVVLILLFLYNVVDDLYDLGFIRQIRKFFKICHHERLMCKYVGDNTDGFPTYHIYCRYCNEDIDTIAVRRDRVPKNLTSTDFTRPAEEITYDQYKFMKYGE